MLNGVAYGTGEQCRLETAIIMEALQHLPTEEERFSTLLDYFQQVVRASYIQVPLQPQTTATSYRYSHDQDQIRVRFLVN